tara:strand:+ start:153 stop:380 length:228 start_codon:yes stop_codon:yes gene_type:complete
MQAVQNPAGPAQAAVPAQAAGQAQQGPGPVQQGGYESPAATPRGECPGAPKPNLNKPGGQGGGLPLAPIQYLDFY